MSFGNQVSQTPLRLHLSFSILFAVIKSDCEKSAVQLQHAVYKIVYLNSKVQYTAKKKGPTFVTSGGDQDPDKNWIRIYTGKNRIN